MKENYFQGKNIIVSVYFGENEISLDSGFGIFTVVHCLICSDNVMTIITPKLFQ